MKNTKAVFSQMRNHNALLPNGVYDYMIPTSNPIINSPSSFNTPGYIKGLIPI